MKIQQLFLLSFLLFSFSAINAQTVTDADGNTYNTVKIGSQIWMKENLRTTKYNDGTAIPNVTASPSWVALTSPAYCWYNNDAATYKNLNGALYNWSTVSTGKLCPTGWRVPSYNDFLTLINYLGGFQAAGPKLRDAASDAYDGNTNSNNSSGLTLRATGLRHNNGAFDAIKTWGGWWASTEGTQGSAVILNVDVSYVGLSSNAGYDKKGGIAVRCMKDDVNGIGTLEISKQVIAFPVPATDKLWLKDIPLGSTVAIFDMAGNKIFETKSDITPLDISNLAKGVYILKINNSGKTAIRRFVKL